MLFLPLCSILVHLGALHGHPHDPHDPHVLNFHQVIKDMYPTHQELSNTTSPTFLAQFIQEILI